MAHLARSDTPIRSTNDLRDTLLARWARLDRQGRRDQDLAAHMLHFLDNPARVLELGLDHLTHELGTARGDAAVVHPDDEFYRPSVQVVAGGAVDDPTPLSLPNRHPIFATMWAGDGPVGFDRVAGNPALGALEPVLTGAGLTALLAAPIPSDDGPLGLICLDETDGRRRFTTAEHERVDGFIRRFLAPVLHAALQRRARRPSALTPAEADAVRLLADGQSYGSIARALGKSPRTIDNQLRAARRKAGVVNAVELTRWWQHSHPMG